MLDPTFHITTTRLNLWYLDPSNDAHMAFLVELQNSPEVIAVGAQSGAKPPAKPLSISDVRESLVARTEKLARTGSGRYIISLRGEPGAEKEYVGYVSMGLDRFPEVQCPKIPDLGFVLLARYYGRGYANEACNALMQHFREVKGFERWAGFTHPENRNSQNLFRRLEFEDRGCMEVAGIVGSGVAMRVSVWTKGVSPDTDLSDLGIGPKKVEEEVDRSGVDDGSAK